MSSSGLFLPSSLILATPYSFSSRLFFLFLGFLASSVSQSVAEKKERKREHHPIPELASQLRWIPRVVHSVEGFAWLHSLPLSHTCMQRCERIEQKQQQADEEEEVEVVPCVRRWPYNIARWIYVMDAESVYIYIEREQLFLLFRFLPLFLSVSLSFCLAHKRRTKEREREKVV